MFWKFTLIFRNFTETRLHSNQFDFRQNIIKLISLKMLSEDINQYLFKADDFLRMRCRQRLRDPLQESSPSERKCRPMVDWHLKHLQQSHISQWEVCLTGNDRFIAPVTGVVSRGFQTHWEVRRSGFSNALYKVVIMGKDRMGPSAENSLSSLLKNLYRIKWFLINLSALALYLRRKIYVHSPIEHFLSIFGRV